MKKKEMERTITKKMSFPGAVLREHMPRREEARLEVDKTAISKEWGRRGDTAKAIIDHAFARKTF